MDNHIEDIENLYLELSIGMSITDSKGTIIKVSSSLLNQLGFNKNELVGKKVRKLIPKALYATNKLDLPIHSNNPYGKKIVDKENIISIKKIGTKFFIEMALDCIISPQVNYLATLVNDASQLKDRPEELLLNDELKTDVQERTDAVKQTVAFLSETVNETKIKDLRIKETNDFLSKIWNNVEAIIFVTNKEGIIKTFNKQAVKHLGYYQDEVIDMMSPKNFIDNKKVFKSTSKRFPKSNSVNLFELIHKKASKHAVSNIEINLIRKDGTDLPVLLSYSKICIESEFEGFVCIAQNISSLNIPENESKINLEKQKELSELRFKLLALVNHEFRTPLSVILNSSHIIDQQVKDGLKDLESIAKPMDHIKKSVGSLNTLLNDLLFIGQLEDDKIPVKKSSFNVAKLIQQTIDELSGLLKDGQKISYRSTGNHFIFFDSGMLKYIIINLISNAIKYSADGSEIDIKSEITKYKFNVTIEDHGIGISKASQKNLFKMFFRGSNVKNIAGHGIGLYIVKTYVEKMGGTIHCDSKLNVGSSMSISFPNLESEYFSGK